MIMIIIDYDYDDINDYDHGYDDIDDYDDK